MKFCKVSLGILLMFFLSILNLSAQSYVEIGVGNQTNNPYPFYTSWNYAWYSAIYPQSAVGAAKSITHLSINMSTNAQKTFNNQKIYLKNDSRVIFGDAGYENPESNGYTKVFEGNLVLNPGWNQIALSTSFAYNGSDNLILHWENRSGSASYANFYATTSTINDNKSSGNDVSFPTTPGYLNPYPSGLPDIRLYYVGLPTPTSEIPVSNSVKNSVSDLVSCELGDGVTFYDMYFATDSAAVALLSASAKVVDNGAVTAPGRYGSQRLF